MLRHTKTTAPSSAAISAMRPVAEDFGFSGWVWAEFAWLDMAISHAAFLTSMMRTLSQRQNTISDTKKTIDGSSSTPSVMCWKCAKNDIEACHDEQEAHCGGADEGQHLALGQRRHGRGERQERARHQPRADVGG